MPTTKPACSRCFRAADVMAFGKFRNGRPARDPRCRFDRPTPDDIGCWLLLGSSDKEFRLERIEAIE